MPRLMRLVKLLEMLRTGLCGEAKDLAARLNVSQRTLMRDLALLRSADVPVARDKELNRYRLLLRGTAERLARLSFEEIEALTIAWASAPIPRDTETDRSGQRAIAKLLATLSPQELYRLASWTREPGSSRKSNAGAMTTIWEQIVLAIRLRQSLRVHLHDGHDCHMTKMIDPQLLVHDGQWAVAGHSTVHSGTVQYPLSSVRSVEILED